jgi:hypothetical protein
MVTSQESGRFALRKSVARRSSGGQQVTEVVNFGNTSGYLYAELRSALI